ncbi:MAG TPA: formaldehyde-activating enzyme [Candidatus Limnocylindrales bacterium]|nr:formaldehyde-activating enzyme [Candidatus Limnocylindrales bacterium]
MTQGEFATRTLIGESFAGSGPNAAHINIVIGRKGGPVETAWTTALATPRAGHIPFLTVLRPNLPVKPMTLFVNKADLREGTHSQLTWGPAQAGVAAGVTQAVADGLVPAGEVDDLLVIVAVWVDWTADDANLVFANNRAATHEAIAAAVRGEPRIEDVVAEVGHPWNASYHEHRN